MDKFDREFDFELWKSEHSELEDIRAKLSDLAKWENLITRYIKP